MKVRSAHLVVIAVMSAIILFSMFIIDYVFSSRYNASNRKYDSQFQEIESAFGDRNYDQVFALGRLILQEERRGPSEIRAKCYIGLSKLKTGQRDDAVQILQYLIDTYPGIKTVYAEQYKANSEENLVFLFTSILRDYIPQYNKVASGMTVSDMLARMDGYDWIRIILLLVGSVIVYEKLAGNKGSSNPND